MTTTKKKTTKKLTEDEKLLIAAFVIFRDMASAVYINVQNGHTYMNTVDLCHTLQELGLQAVIDDQSKQTLLASIKDQIELVTPMVGDGDEDVPFDRAPSFFDDMEQRMSTLMRAKASYEAYQNSMDTALTSTPKAKA